LASDVTFKTTLLAARDIMAALHSAAQLPPTVLSVRSVVQQFSTLELLRDVNISIAMETVGTDDLLSGLPSGLTRLRVDDARMPEDEDKWDRSSDPATLPAQMPQLSALQELDLIQAVIHASVLSHMSGLQSLCMYLCSLLPLSDGGDEAAVTPTFAAKAAAAAAFLAAIGRMTNLRKLVIQSDLLDCPEAWGLNAAPPAAYAALTASSKLQRLVLHAQDVLPSGAVAHMFPQVRSLGVAGDDGWGETWAWGGVSKHVGWRPPRLVASSRSYISAP
jgi:hypothetical protein